VRAALAAAVLLRADGGELTAGFEGGSNSVVESQPSKLLVAGSIPVSRSRVEAFCGRAAEQGEAGSSQPKSRAERGI
jgi:hypothetical protein